METKFKIGDTVYVLQHHMDVTDTCKECLAPIFTEITEPKCAVVREISAKWDAGGVLDQWFHLTFIDGNIDLLARNAKDVFASEEEAMTEYENQKKALEESKDKKPVKDPFVVEGQDLQKDKKNVG